MVNHPRSSIWALLLIFTLALPYPVNASNGFEEVFEKHNDAMLLIDPGDGRIVDANLAAAQFYGYTRDQLRAMKIQDINQLTAAQVEQERRLAKTEGRSYFIFRHQLADGTIRTVQVYSIPVNYNGRIVLYSTIHDISNERVLEDDLWHYQTQLEEMVDRQTKDIQKDSRRSILGLSIGAGLLLLLALYLLLTLRKHRKAEKALAVNHQSVLRLQRLSSAADRDFESKVNELLEMGCDVFGMPLGIVSRIEGDTYTVMYACSPNGALIPGTVYDLNNTYCIHTLNSDAPTAFVNVGKSEIAEHPCYKGFGLESYIGIQLMVGGQRYGTLNFSSLEPHSEPFSTSEYTLIRLFADWVENELTRKDYETDIILAKSEADLASRAKSEFLASMSHELRTPLNSIIGFAEMMKYEIKGPLPSVYIEYTGFITKSGKLLLETVNSILDLAKIEADKFELY
ncbi:histidine kinase dimerization/phospho-acceptor domain-containing protein, partial [Magnetovibrio blakemorei]|uniref:histidine kinase dimerization/phospho-acceptor domain-containing protein n=1 Tax=Magnetovibrio blakemorei TaxID=28181 RepID=UPI001112FA83